MGVFGRREEGGEEGKKEEKGRGRGKKEERGEGGGAAEVREGARRRKKEVEEGGDPSCQKVQQWYADA